MMKNIDAAHGYTNKTVKAYEMTVGGMVLNVAKNLIELKKTDIQIRVVDCRSAEVDVFDNLNHFLTYDWPADYRVTVYQLAIMGDAATDSNDYVKVLLDDNIEGMEESDDEEAA